MVCVKRSPSQKSDIWQHSTFLGHKTIFCLQYRASPYMTAGVSKSPGLPGDCLGSYKKTTLSIAPVSPGWGIKIRSYLWVRLKVWFFARQLFSNTHPSMTQHVRPFYGSELRLWKKNILAPLCHIWTCPVLQTKNSLVTKKS